MSFIRSALFIDYQKLNSEKNTVKNYRLFLARFKEQFGSQDVKTVTPDEILTLLIDNTAGQRQSEMVFIPQKVADRLKSYIQDRGCGPENRIFPIQSSAARNIVKNTGRLIGVELRPHDLRRHAATYASRAGAPLEIVSKVILRHSNLSTA